MSKTRGSCPRCGLGYYGWALDQEFNRFCLKCGSPLEIEGQDSASRTGLKPNTRDYEVRSEWNDQQEIAS